MMALTPAAPGCVSAWEKASVSIMAAPRSAKRWATVDFPQPMPPVRPMQKVFITRLLVQPVQIGLGQILPPQQGDDAATGEVGAERNRLGALLARGTDEG